LNYANTEVKDFQNYIHIYILWKDSVFLRVYYNYGCFIKLTYGQQMYDIIMFSVHFTGGI
jgi:hypothetical protein